MDRFVEIDGVRLHLGHADPSEGEWIGQREIVTQLLACWLVVDDKDLPLTPRLVGPPGFGKTTLGMSGARMRKQPLFVYQCTADTRPEDLLVTPVLAESGKIQYQASPLVTAMLVGGVCVLDEGNRMNEKSWASLAPLLDHRRYVESIVAGITIRAHQERHYPGRVVGTNLRNPDFAALARAFGAHGETVERTADFLPAFERAVSSKKLAVLDLRMDPEVITTRTTLSAIRARALGRR